MKIKNQRCENCRFWDTTEQSNPTPGSVDMGECRRLPPVCVLGQSPILLQVDEYPEEALDNAQRAVWPVTRDWDWCGEWKEATGQSTDIRREAD